MITSSVAPRPARQLDVNQPDCPDGDRAIRSTLWTGGRSRAFSEHLLICARCRAVSNRLGRLLRNGHHRALGR